ncbi:uncharacterized protein LOC114361743 [Ostrinia furnacalis]|uniref:uncharacterized protein LOC114361743 n=1 Tax=Ostrinia furnacalis TaxID=93504 RepID=UPI00104002AA|nr:uncharacterized protein LOC114361743 [Ostrinia furnacalis]
MQAAPARYVSVSELYSTDEVELLLDEIRELEPTSCRGEDVQDFEIAGSGCGAGGGGRSPAGTEATERSWDSHAQYRRAAGVRARALAPLYCRARHLLTARGACTLGVVLLAGAAAACVWAAVGLRAAALPLAPRVQLLQLAALSSALLHAALLLMHVSGLNALMPIDWNKLSTLTSAWSALSLTLGGALTLHAVLCAPEYRWAPEHIARLLCSASGLGLGGACASGALLGAAGRGCRGWWAAAAPRAAYRAVPSAPPAPAAPSAAAPAFEQDEPL